MTPQRFHVPNPKRVAAGKRNRLLRQGLTEEGRQRLRAAALRHQPWRFSTGPTTPAGKAQVRRNGKKRQLGPNSVREIRAALAELNGLLSEMRQTRQVVEELCAHEQTTPSFPPGHGAAR